MAGKVDLITFEQAGFPVELLDERDWRRAITTRRLARSTEVVIYRGASPPRRDVAEHVPELRLLFNELDPTERAEPASGPLPLTPQQPAADVGEAQQTGDQAGAVWDLNDSPWREDPSETSDIFGPGEIPESEEAVEPDNSAMAIGVAVVLALAVAGFIAAITSGDRSAAPVEALPEQQSYRVKEPANARTGPTTNASRVRTLRRNAILVGSTVQDERGRTWVRVSEGEHAGLYVWTGNLEVEAGAGGMGNRPF